MTDYATGDRVTVNGELATVAHSIPGTGDCAVGRSVGEPTPADAVATWHARLQRIAAAANRPPRPRYGSAGRWT